MERIGIILHSLDTIGAILVLIVGFFLALRCILKREKVFAWIFGILTFLLVILLCLSLILPSTSFGFLFGLITLIILIMQLIRLNNISKESDSYRIKNDKRSVARNG